MKQTVIPGCSRKSLMFQEAHTTTSVFYHLSILEHSYCRLSSISFLSSFPLPRLFPIKAQTDSNLCQAKDKLSILDIIHWLNLFSGVSWGYPDQWLQANIWAPMALCHPKRWKELRKGKRPTGGVRKCRSERFRLRLTGIWQRGFRARMTHCGYSISWVSLRDLTAPGKDSFFISYNVTVIQPQREKPSANHGSRSQWTRCAEWGV